VVNSHNKFIKHHYGQKNGLHWTRKKRAQFIKALYALHGNLMKWIIGTLVALFSYSAWACSCSAPDLTSLVKDSDNIFIGKVVSVEDRDYLSEKYEGVNVLKGRIVVQETLKGSVEKELVLYTGFGQGDCGLGFQTRDTYIFFMSSGDIVSGCQGHILDATYRYKSSCFPDEDKLFGNPTFEDKLKKVRRLIANGI